MKISYAICTHNEGKYIETLLEPFSQIMTQDDSNDREIVIVDDNSTDELTKSILHKYQEIYGARFHLSNHALDNDYASHKNHLNSLCSGEWIFNLDADEYVSQQFLLTIDSIIAANTGVEAFWVPRVNTVDGITREHIKHWNWTISKLDGDEFIVKDGNPSLQEYDLLMMNDLIISESNETATYYKPIICWPDYQMRLYRNAPTIKWVNRVHEQLVGFKRFGTLPQLPEYAIRHYKTISRQEQQNEFYQRLMR
jgi:glycosyltransferase involved in cell wall biosynthesis